MLKKEIPKKIKDSQILKKGFKVESRFDKKAKLERRLITTLLTDFLDKAGIELTPKEFHRQIIRVDLLILGFATFITVLFALINHASAAKLFTILLFLWTIILGGIYFASILVVLLYLDIRIFNRTKQIEDVLPDFLQLTSANISAGMTIDRALWYAVRPRFGVLAKEMEEIAKATIAGEDLEKALLNFSRKYDSRVLKESVNLIIAGIRAGGELGDLLNKISINIQETKLMKKEISASVTTYVIFIGVASIVAAPALFGLSTQLLVIIQSLAGSLSVEPGTNVGMTMSFSISQDTISVEDFRIFAYIMLSITAFFSAAIINVIRKGNVKEGIKLMPIFVAVSLTIYTISAFLLSIMLGSFF